ncbi:MAG TPA: ATP-binding protein [Solirubrobacteraceae bacterium]|nr:ATP-binding protein [Solirubrobacteraceae bacterium]
MEGNPYAPGAGRVPTVLAGRDRETGRFVELLDELVTGGSERSLITVGFRGMGKTVLLNRFEILAEQRGCVTQYCEPDDDATLSTVITRAASRLLGALKLSRRVQAAVSERLSVLEAFALEESSSGLRLRLSANIDDRSALANDMTAVLIEIGQAAREKNTPAIFLVDEMQAVDLDELKAFLVGLHRVTQLQLPLVLVGTGLPQLPELIAKARPYGTRMFDFFPVGCLDRASCEDAIRGPAKTKGVEYTRDAVAELVGLTEGYPYYVQIYGRHVWKAASAAPITLQEVTEAAPLARAEMESGFLAGRLGETTDAERAYLLAMAQLTDTCDIEHVERGSRRRASFDMRATRESLISAGHICLEDGGRLSFTVPGFGDYVVRRLDSDLSARG